MPAETKDTKLAEIEKKKQILAEERKIEDD